MEVEKPVGPIALAQPIIGEEEKQALCRVLDSGWLTMGDNVRAFERAFADLHGASDAVAVNSCTAGLHLCLAALGIGRSDEVLVPSLTFVATVNAVLHVGAIPVFVDIEDESQPHVSLDQAMAKCTARTRAVIVMHYGGYVANMTPWRALADERRIRLIEDAAHAPGVAGAGCMADAAAFSFFSNKNMSTAEGGMILARDDSVLARARQLRSHAMTACTLDRDRGHAYSYDVSALGYNYRMDELRAALGLVQLAHVSQWNARRRELSCYYRKKLADEVSGIAIPFGEEWESAAHLMPILLPKCVSRNKVMENLRLANIQSSIHYPPVHRFTYYRERFPGVSLPNTESFCARELTLPLHPSLEPDDVDRVVAALGSAI